jgi:fumarate hydratase class I
VLELTRQFGIGAQFGGKYFCHDVRVIRLPRHGASLPGRDRRLLLGRPAVPGQDHPDGVFIEQLETEPATTCPETRHRPTPRPGDGADAARPVVVDRPEPTDGARSSPS